ncbi:MAG TPA: nucleotidyltransferase family protein [Rhodanobacteraceae bacterium]|nr:nucleotidyltransferase family protein [Rhodanobacteraceae bacterium]
MLPPLKIIRAGLRRTTEALASELACPGGPTPTWSELDWQLAMAAATAHGVSPLLRKHSGWTHPRWRQFLENQHEEVAIRHRRIAALLEHIDARSHAAGLAMVPLKGAALHALGLYTPGDRPMADIDLLVREEDVHAATRLLLGIGYVPSFDDWRHRVFKPAAGVPPAVLGEHRDTPVNIELHARIRERLPVSVVDITERILRREPRPGLNPYPSRSALLAHLLLHAAGNMCGRSLRLMHLHDIALLARSMQPEEWIFLWRGRACWWALPPLQMVARHYQDAIPDTVLATLARDCPPLLRAVSRRRTLAQVSCSELWLHAFPGLEWSRGPLDAARFVAGRIRRSPEQLRERNDMARAQLWLRDRDWVMAPQPRRILTWLTRKVPRMDMMYAVRMALAHAISEGGENDATVSAEPGAAVAKRVEEAPVRESTESFRHHPDLEPPAAAAQGSRFGSRANLS